MELRRADGCEELVQGAEAVLRTMADTGLEEWWVKPAVRPLP